MILILIYLAVGLVRGREEAERFRLRFIRENERRWQVLENQERANSITNSLNI